jgi:hypothetical protein
MNEIHVHSLNLWFWLARELLELIGKLAVWNSELFCLYAWNKVLYFINTWLWLMNQVNNQLSLLAIANHIQIRKNSCMHFIYCVWMLNLYAKMQYFFYQVTGATVIREAGIERVPCVIRDLGPTVCPDWIFVRQMLGYKPACFLPWSCHCVIHSYPWNNCHCYLSNCCSIIKSRAWKVRLKYSCAYCEGMVE